VVIDNSSQVAACLLTLLNPSHAWPALRQSHVVHEVSCKGSQLAVRLNRRERSALATKHRHEHHWLAYCQWAPYLSEVQNPDESLIGGHIRKIYYQVTLAWFAQW